MSTDIIICAEALRHFLERHNIPGRRRIRLVIVAEEPRTAAEIEMAIKSDLTPGVLDLRRGAVPHGYLCTIAEVAIAVRVPKPAVEV